MVLHPWSNAHLFWPYLYISLIFLSQLNKKKSGQVGFSSEYFFKSEQIDQKGPKNTQKGPFSENASNFLSPLLFLKMAKSPLFLGKTQKIVRTIFKKSAQFFEKLKKPTLQKLKVGRNYINFPLPCSFFPFFFLMASLAVRYETLTSPKAAIVFMFPALKTSALTS